MKKLKTKIYFDNNLDINENSIEFNFIIKTNEQNKHIKLKEIDLKKKKINGRDSSARLF